ncbi:MAG: right-handed parallel beta-helix repeat-containing protein [Candidatus Peribacteraceae bacterium]|nr:right-handed parallel beta-helix repeat-containing protein [Candidatus Peribacteraceae bacterium]
MKKLITLIMILTSALFAGIPSEVNHDDYVPMSVTTHQFSSGNLFTDAPTYRVYEMTNVDGVISTTEILGPTALTVDFDSITGHHTESFQASTANGFDVGNYYIVLFEATVDSVSGGFSEIFRVRPAVTNVNVTQWDGTQVSTPTIAGVPEVDAIYHNGGAIVVPLAAATDQSEHDATQSDIAALNDLSAAEVRSEADDALTAYGANTTVPMAAATSQTEHDATQSNIAEVDKKVDRNASLFESLRGHHSYQGNYYYVDPVNGNDGNTGGKSDPYATIQACHDNSVIDSNHDVIFLVAGHASQTTVHTVAVTTTLSKRYLKIAGPGRDFIATRTGNGDTFTVTADGVFFTGLQISTAATGSGDGIDIQDADFVGADNCWFVDTAGDGIHGTRVSNLYITDNHFESSGAEGVHIDGTGVGNSEDNVIYNNHFADTVNDGIRIENGTIIDTTIINNVIHNSGGYGVNISADSTDAIVVRNILNGNTSGPILDAGINTLPENNEQWAKEETVTVDGVTVEEMQDSALADFANVDTTLDETNVVPGSVIAIGSRDTWEEELTSAKFSGNEAGKKLIGVAANTIITGTSPDTGGTTNTSILIELDSDASISSGAYDPSNLVITSGTGMGQSRQCWEYLGGAGGDGLTKLYYINRDWKTIPDNTSTYTIYGSSGDTSVNEGLARGGTANTIILNELASTGATSYLGQIVFLGAGTGADDWGVVIAYNTGTQTATVHKNWDVTPVNGQTMYAMYPIGTLLTGDSFARIGVDGAGLINIDLPDQTMDITGDMSGTVGDVVANVGIDWGDVANPTSTNNMTQTIIGVTTVTGSVAGNVGGNLVGNVEGNVEGSVYMLDDIAVLALSRFFDTDSGETFETSVDGSVVKEITDNTSGTGTSPAAVWAYDISAIIAAGLAGTQLNSAASGGTVASDMYTDITVVPWEEVYHVIGDPGTEYYREALYTAQGTPITSSNLKIGKRVRQ